jgi:hypothetical protein
MALTVDARTFGIRQVGWYTYNVGADTYGSLLLFDAAQEFTVNIEADEAVLVGDDVELERIPFNRRVTVSATFGGNAMEVEAAITGAAIATTGTTPNQVKTLTLEGTDLPTYGKLVGRMVLSDAVGDYRVEIPYLRFFTGPQGSGSNGAFGTSQYSGTGIPHPVSGVLIRKIQNETAAVLA